MLLRVAFGRGKVVFEMLRISRLRLGSALAAFLRLSFLRPTCTVRLTELPPRIATMRSQTQKQFFISHLEANDPKRETVQTSQTFQPTCFQLDPIVKNEISKNE